MFEKSFVAGWGDMDFNSHMRNTAFLDRSADVRMMFFAENGFPVEEFLRRKIGPVILRDELEYFREVRLLEEYRVTLRVAAFAGDGSRFVMRNEFWRSEETRIAQVSSEGLWLDLTTRKPVVAPDALLEAMRTLPRTEDFVVLPSRFERE